jgi:hypothetical protein
MAATPAPACAKRSAVALPIPEVAPVTITAFAANSFSIGLFLLRLESRRHHILTEPA